MIPTIDTELIQKGWRLEDPPGRIKQWMEEISEVDLGIYEKKLELACEEGKEVLVRTAISNVSQSGDCIVGIYTPGGDLAIASVGTYLHTMSGPIPIKFILKHFKDDPTVGIQDGDIFFANEGLYAIHNPDNLILVPVFNKGELIAWVGSASHEPETGSIEPGGMVATARNRWQEGLKVTPIKVGEDFQLKSDLLTMIGNMVRDEHMIIGDARARTAACLKTRQRILEVVEEKGFYFVVGLLYKVTQIIAEAARKKVKELPDGIFRQSVFFDSRGVSPGLGVVTVAVIKKGDQIKLDFTASPATYSALNAFPQHIRAHLGGDLCQYFLNDLPASSGLLQPFEIEATPGSCLNPPWDAAIAICTKLAPLAVTAVHACLNKMMFCSPYREFVAVPLGISRTINYLCINQYGRAMVQQLVATPNSAGGGARPDQDGVNCAGFYFSGIGDCLDAEHEEMHGPFLFLFRKFTMDQGGPGKYRGGLSMGVTLIPHQARYFHATSSTWYRWFPCDIGLFGGYAASPAPFMVVRGDWYKHFSEGAKDVPFSFTELAMRQEAEGKAEFPIGFGPASTPPFKNGESISWAGVSSGGYGDVLERDPELVMRDVRMGIVSHWAARHVYHVIYDGETLKVDYERTKEEKEKERVDRKRRGKPYEEFEKGWLKKKPNPDIIKDYGTWPDPSVGLKENPIERMGG